MKKQFSNITMLLALLLALLGANVRRAGASTPRSQGETVVSTGMILPIPPAVTPALGVSGVHPSGLARVFKKDPTQIDMNPNSQGSSIDLIYSGNVVAPMSGTITIPADCPT